MARTDVLYETADLLVRRQPACGDVRDFWVTFNGLEAREPTASGFIQREGAGALHVITKRDDWYQVVDADRLAALIAANKPEGFRLILFGSSMGAFGAIALSSRLDADLVIVGGPQVRVDPDQTAEIDVCWADRWRAIKDRGDLKTADARTGASERAPIIVFYDPWTREDRWHARELAELKTVFLCRLPGAGHPVLYHLTDLGLWVAFMQAALIVDHTALERLAEIYRRTKRKNYFYICSIGMLLRSRGRFFKAAEIYRRAARMRPDLHQAHFYLRDALASGGDLNGATEAARAAVDQIRGRSELWTLHIDLVRTLAAQNRYDEVEDAYARAVDEFPDSADLNAAFADFRVVLGRRPELSLPLWKRAVELAPTRSDYREGLEAALAREAASTAEATPPAVPPPKGRGDRGLVPLTPSSKQPPRFALWKR